MSAAKDSARQQAIARVDSIDFDFTKFGPTGSLLGRSHY
jgi:hypothetical protein